MPEVILGIKMYSIEETAEVLSVSVETVKNYTRSGKLKGEKIGRRKLISEDAIKALLNPNFTRQQES